MNDHLDSVDEPTAQELAAIDALLAVRDVWDDPPSDLEDRVVAAIAEGERNERRDHAGLVGHDDRRSRRAGRTLPRWLAAAAVAALVVAGIALATRGDNDARGTQFALAGTAAAPNATADVTLSSTPAGLKILFDAEGLDPAPDGFFYEAWVSNGTIGVSAGTFHLRSGAGPIELWAGVADSAFHTLAVTLEPLDGDTSSSRDVRLIGRFDLVGG